MVKPVFADRLLKATREYGPLCVGIDPHEDMLPALFGPVGAASITRWGQAVVEQCVGRVGIVKPQAALFERWGSKGIAALEKVCEAATKAGLIVLLDAKRGDIGSTAAGYARGYLSSSACCKCDAITVNPYMGVETIEPLVEEAEKARKGVIVLARTSNPGAADFQAATDGGEPVFQRVARSLQPLAERLMSKEGQWSGLMLVVGAASPDEARKVREAAPKSLFLVPGYGAQGASAEEAMSGFRRGPGGMEGGVVNASRSVTYLPGTDEAETADQWDEAIAKAINAAQNDLRAAAGYPEDEPSQS